MFPKLKDPSILAPMSGVTDVAFRELCKRYGAGMTFTEFVSSAAMVRGNAETFRMLKVASNEKPVGVQIFGSCEEEVAGAAVLLQERFDVIDINCGCPSYKVIKTGAGSNLLGKPEEIAKLVRSISSQIKKPVTVKIRTGLDMNRINAVEVAKLAEKAGAAAITVHGRTQKQGYSGKADWDTIKKVADAVKIPVIGNGDVSSPEIFSERMKESGVHAVMIGRAAMTNPYIFRQVNNYLKKGSYDEKPKREIFFEYLKLAGKHKVPFLTVKHHAVSFSKGLVGGSVLREKLVKCRDPDSLEKTFQNL